jgi:TusA-related sulfurtransferase
MATDTNETTAVKTLDVKGASCPMPVVRTKQAVDDLEVGEVLEVLATDAGSVSDIDGWASTLETVALREQTESEDDGTTVYHHRIERVEA